MKESDEVNYQMVLLDLYAGDIKKRLAVNHSYLGDLPRLLKAGEVERLKEQYPYDWTTFAECLWRLLLEAPTRGALYDCILAFIYQCEGESQLHRRLRVLYERSRRSYILPILIYANEFLKIMDAESICKGVSSLSEEHRRIVQHIKQTLHDKGQVEANKHILRLLPDLHRDTVFDFMNEIRNCGDDCERLVDELYPNFQIAYQSLLRNRQEKSARRGVVYYVGLQTPLSEVMEACGSSDASSFKIDLNFEYFPPTEAQKAIDDVIEALYNEDIMPLRKYQEELAEPAYNGYNTVVCAPTGSGKTVVAASVIRQHLLQGLLSGEKRKVCFFVTNTTFLEQQAELMRNFLRNRWKVIALSGATAGEAPLLLTLSDNDVIVITPQLIVNLLETQNTQDDLMKFSLTMFSLLVFDEAHHANLNHPYNEILFAYHSMKRTGALPHSERLPQVIGLTASLGVHGAQNEGEARCHIIRMCANLDVQKLSRVRFNTSELLRYSTIAVDESRFVESAHRSTPFYRAVDRLMESFENRFLTALFMGDNMMPTLGDPKNFNPPKERDIQAYQNWFENLLSRSIPVMDIGRQERICIVECLQYIKVFYLTLQLCAHFPCDVAQCFLREELEELGRSASLEIRQIINESRVLEPLAENKCVNALYEILLKEVRSEFVNNPDGRAIVFVRTRDFAFRLRDAMNADDVLRGNNIRSEVMTGINVSAEEGGQNANVQRDKLNQFANGEVKVLCATSVAEEGIDIKKCTLVISYNYTTNEIAHVQRRGRGRAERSRYLLLTHDRKLAKRDEQNIMREKLMNMALDRIDSMPEVWFRQQVDDCIRKINEERIRAKLSRPMEQKAIDTNEVYDLRCRKCDVLICTSESVATDSKNTHYFCVDPEIWKRVVCCIEFPKQKKAEETPFVGVGSHHCANRSCNEHWGRIVREKKIALPVLRPGAFVLVSPRKQRIAVSEWKQVKEHFSPREIDSHDYVVMSNALQRPNCAT